MRRWLVLLVIAAPTLLHGQAPDQKPVSFDAASVKPNASSSGMVRVSMPPGRFSASNVTVRLILRTAYNMPVYRMVDGPSWLDIDRFDVEATAGSAVRVDQISAMTKTLLEDRFKLRAHVEMREMPIYVLSLARRDGTLGDQISLATSDCKPTTPRASAPPPPPAPPASDRTPASPQCPSLLGLGNIIARRLPIDRLATTLAQWLNRDVRNQTGLDGLYDFNLRWMPDVLPNLPPGAPPPYFAPDTPPLFTAVQEQLGLKLEASKGPVDVLVIDHVERPTPD